MKFDGQQYTASRKAVTLPREMWEGEDRNYVTFGRVCKRDTPNAIKTNHVYTTHSPFGDTAELPDAEGKSEVYPVYAVPVKSDGHSTTSLMYGKDGYAYLLHGGQVYVRWIGTQKQVREARLNANGPQVASPHIEYTRTYIGNWMQVMRKGVPDGGLELLLRRIIFNPENRIDWGKARADLLELCPDLTPDTHPELFEKEVILT